MDCVRFCGVNVILSKSINNVILLWQPIVAGRGGVHSRCSKTDADDVIPLREFNLHDDI